ncbi:ubiquitin-activating enzyme E1 1-like protein isoform X2 [Tanacetum coccineum]
MRRPVWSSIIGSATKCFQSIGVSLSLELDPYFQPKQGAKIETDENVTNLSSLPSIDDFEKDDDTNYHMDFIAGLANMRARNYSILDVDKLRAKNSWKNHLTIATSTAMATGLDAYSISCGSCLLFNSMFSRHNERMDKKVVDLARDVAKMEIPSYLRHLDLMVACEDEEENDIDISQVSVYFR